MFDDEIGKATQWLLDHKSKIGGWSGPFPDREWSGVWTTAGVIVAYYSWNNQRNTQIDTGIKWLIDQQNEDGGWPRIQSDLSSVESTAWAIMALFLSSPTPMSIGSISLRKGVLWMLKVQRDDGGWDFHAIPDGDSRVIPTGFSVISLLPLLGISDETLNTQLENSLQKACKWLISRQQNDGGWANSSGGKPDNFSTAIAMLSLSRLFRKFSTGNLEVLHRSQKWIIPKQLENGQWQACNDRILYKTFSSVRADEKPIEYLRDLYWDWFSTPWVMAALVESGTDVASDAVQRGLRYILELQTDSGGWRYGADSAAMFWSTYQISYCLRVVSTHLDAKSLYKVFEARLRARDELIRQLNADPSLAEEYNYLIKELNVSSPVTFGKLKGIYMSKRLTVFSIILCVLVFVICLISLLFPSNLYFLIQYLNTTYLKLTVSVLFVLLGSFFLYILKKVIKMSKENLYITLFGFLIGLILYLLS